MTTADTQAALLIEIGCEDLPAASLQPLSQYLADGVQQALVDAGLGGDAIEIFATPRRLAVLMHDVGATQSAQQVERRGPSVKAAYDADGQPTRALLGFLKSAGASAGDVQRIDTPKGEWVVVRQVQPGRSLAEVLAAALPEIVRGMPMPRRMRWADQPHEFLRPVEWLVAMHGDTVLALELFGLEAGRDTRGHRFHAPDPLPLTSATDYAAALMDARVVASFPARRERIASQVAEAAVALGGQAVSDEDLLDEVTALVEWPVAVSGRFEERFLEIPKEALIQTMQENQRYFALLDDSGALLPCFITIANIESRHPQSVVDGNERVIRPRFEDTMFFWQQDKARSLASLAGELDRVLFQEKLGSVGDKQRRLQSLAAWIAPEIGADPEHCQLAASLCKCDLVTEIVKELPKMQGICGRYYAARDGHADAIAVAMEEHYYPKQSGGALPSNPVAEAVSIADKADTIAGIYGLGMKPTGARDPFALRRAALGILRILIENEHDVALEHLFDNAVAVYGAALPEADVPSMVDYVLDRLRGYALEQGYTADVIDAVLARAGSNPLDIMQRLAAIRRFRQGPAAASLAAASKRIGNILKKQGIGADGAAAGAVDDSLLGEAAEKNLYSTLLSVRPDIHAQFQARDYAQAMTTLSALRDDVDAFFDQVMVMTDDAARRNNRLALLAEVLELCSHTADLSALQPQES